MFKNCYSHPTPEGTNAQPLRGIISLYMILLIILGSSAVLAAQGEAPKKRAKVGQATSKLLTEIAEEVIRVQGEAQVTGSLLTSMTALHGKSYREFLSQKEKSFGMTSGRYNDYEGLFKVRWVKATASGVTVRIMEHGILTFDNPDKDPGMPVTEEYEYEHEVSFIFENHAWKVVGDQVVNLPRSAVPSLTPHSIPRYMSTLPYFVSSDPRVESSDSMKKIEAGASFSRSAAANYALQYWSNYNPSYRSFSPTDCTNFVSQAMRAGGWTDNLGWYQSSSNWWYNSSNQTWTWVNADMWGDFTYNYPRASIAAYVSDLRVGDVLEADWEGDGTIDHAMVVTSKSATDIYLTYHSNNQKDKPFSTILSGNPNAVWYGYLMYSSF